MSAINSPASDAARFELLYKTYCRSMLYMAYDLLHDHNLAEDAVQNAFLKILKYMGQMEDIQGLRTKRFISIVVRCCAIDILRKHENKVFSLDAFEEEPLAPCESQEEILCSDESYQDLLQAINQLDDRYRDVLFCRFVQKLSIKETAELLSISETNVGSRTHRAKQILKKKLEMEKKA